MTSAAGILEGDGQEAFDRESLTQQQDALDRALQKVAGYAEARQAFGVRQSYYEAKDIFTSWTVSRVGAKAEAAKAEAPAEGKKPGEKGSGKKEEKKEGAQIWIGNLAEKIATEEEIRKHFGGFGQITDVKFKMNKKRNGDLKLFYAFATYGSADQAKAAVEAMNGQVISEGTEPLQVSFADRQLMEGGKGKEGKGKGKEAKGGGKGTTKGKGKGKDKSGQTNPYYPYTPEQVQYAWAMHAQYYQQLEAHALQAQAYYSGFTGQVIPSQAAISAASQSAGTSTAKTPAAPPSKPPPPPDKEFTGQVKSISAKNGYGFIICDETKKLYGRDVFVEQKVLPEGVEVQSKVTFTIELSEKGHPRATKVNLVAGA
ncbi:PABPC4 [Symbiodinium natans]|uniref:PABPC4 protein n=1 Tax=Symbiodinium natans TaxID=878477 RepID=A0A812NNZ7_9DINO|nr:PABPC4 [Symbiodinium natans]